MRALNVDPFICLLCIIPLFEPTDALPILVVTHFGERLRDTIIAGLLVVLIYFLPQSLNICPI